MESPHVQPNVHSGHEQGRSGGSAERRGCGCRMSAALCRAAATRFREKAWTWTVVLAAADTSSRGLKRPFSEVYTGWGLFAGGTTGAADSRAGLPRFAAGPILGAPFRTAFAGVGPSHQTPLAPVHVHTPASAKLPLPSRLKRLHLLFGESSTDYHSVGRLPKWAVQRQTPQGLRLVAIMQQQPSPLWRRLCRSKSGWSPHLSAQQTRVLTKNRNLQ
jgi:hypothetical protein